MTPKFFKLHQFKCASALLLLLGACSPFHSNSLNSFNGTVTCDHLLDAQFVKDHPELATFDAITKCKEEHPKSQASLMQALGLQIDKDCDADHVALKPELQQEFIAQEQILRHARMFMSDSQALVAGETLYTIPLVFHVLHLGEPVGIGNNISDAQIESAVTELNRQFRKEPGTSGDGAGEDVGIQFVLAKRDPNGNPTSGIVRVNASNVPLYATEGIEASSGGGANEEATKALSTWPRTDYINIWVVSEIANNDGGSGIQGYAYFPINNPIDGIVILGSATGTIGTVKSYTNQGKVLTHEMGHVFRLYHTFNGTSSCTTEANCGTNGDQVCDTPVTIQSTSCNNPACGGTQQVENYMDYTSQSCQNMFTAGQKTRMRDALTVFRTSLINSLGAIPVNNLDLSIQSTNLPPYLCDGNFAPTANIRNLGSTTITSAVVRYRQGTGAWQSVNYSGSLASGASASVTLPSIGSLSSGTNTFEFNVTSPNGGTDQSLANNTLTQTTSIGSESLNVQFTLDYYGAENSFIVKSGNTNLFNGGPFQNGAQGTIINNPFCVPAGCYDVIISDAFGDGQGFTSGGHKIINGQGTILFQATGDWGSQVTYNACIGGATPSNTPTPTPSGDTTAPTVSLTAPVNNAISNAASITLSASASDNVGISKVEFYRGTTLVSSDSTSPYSVSMSTSGLSSGSYSITAKAFDTSSNTTVSSAVTLIIDKVNPTGSITSPANASAISGASLTITANASDTNGINKVEFYEGSTLLGNDTTSPYSYTWNTSTLSPGSYTLSIKVFDNAGNSFIPSSISVSKENTSGTAVTSTFIGTINSCYTRAQYESFMAAYNCNTGCNAVLDTNGDGKLLSNDLVEILSNLCPE